MQPGEKLARSLVHKDRLRMGERLVLDLATALEQKKNPNYCVVSWASQVEAAAFIEEHGELNTIKRIVELEG
jgi:hypothetical protein